MRSEQPKELAKLIQNSQALLASPFRLILQLILALIAFNFRFQHTPVDEVTSDIDRFCSVGWHCFLS